MAGSLVMGTLGLRSALAGIDTGTEVGVRQRMIRSLRRVMPIVMVGSILTSGLAAFGGDRQPKQVLGVFGFVLCLGVFGITLAVAFSAEPDVSDMAERFSSPQLPISARSLDPVGFYSCDRRRCRDAFDRIVGGEIRP